MVMDLDQREELRHKEWLGLLQPVGLVVAPKALMNAQAYLPESRGVIELQQDLQGLFDENGYIPNFKDLAGKVLGWLDRDLISDAATLTQYEVNLREYQDILQPSFVVPDPHKETPLMFVQELRTGQAFDEVDPDLSQQAWQVSPQAKFERLLRENKIPTGLLFNGKEVRLVYAPLGESSGYLTFPLGSMTEVAGRLILGAMDMLLGSDRLFNSVPNRNLNDILKASRKYQSEVSTELSKQVVDALWELLKGFQEADKAAHGTVLGDLPETDPQQIYGGLITTLLRLVFLLYAEDEGLMPGDDIYTQNYSVTGLFERLQQDVGNYPDTMDQRYGAWAWLLSLFRLVYDGGGVVPDYLPARRGELFDPQTYPFLEGESSHDLPRVSDGVVYRVLSKLLILDGDRLSYRALDVEDIGSVYEAIMGFEVERATGRSIGLWSKPNNAKVPVTTVINLEALLAVKTKDRSKWLKENAGCDLAGNAEKALKSAKTIDDLLVALEKRISPHTPYPLTTESLYLQPGEERRRTGSHYTPRVMTEPIVKDTLSPIFEQMGENPTPEQILDLKVCDPAMGSGAFLVQVCRQLAEELVKAWEVHKRLGEVPPEDEPLLHARRLIAQRCIYGVDRNPFAVQLAKLSLWLVTLAKNHSFMFLDHALKCGDSLVGLTKAEIGSFLKKSDVPLMDILAQNVAQAITFRTEISNAKDEDYQKSKSILGEAEAALESPKLAGQLAVAAMFAEKTKKKREEKLKEFANSYQLWQSGTYEKSDLEKLYQNAVDPEKPLIIFHWDLEFPEVFQQKNPGFDVIVGNPPFAGKNTLINGNPENYVEYLKVLHPESHGNADVVAHFFRRSFNLLRCGGTLGLIATNTISQGDTRQSGLRFICNHGGIIYNTKRRYKWPGLAAVVVSVLQIFKPAQNSNYQPQCFLDGQLVDHITAFLVTIGGNETPHPLKPNEDKSYQGSIILGMGFTFDDTDKKGEATPIAEMEQLIAENPHYQEVIFPYIGGSEVNSSPTHSHHRYVINFGEMPEDEAREKYPDLMAIVEQKVKPERDKLAKKSSSTQKKRAKYWWQFGGGSNPGLQKAIAPLSRVLVIPCGATSNVALSFLDSKIVFANTLAILTFENHSAFAVLQSRIHEVWTRFFGSSMKDDLRYTPSDCFETFPFPEDWEENSDLEAIGQEYYEYRAELMVKNDQGLTDTYNRFHDPGERHPDIDKLRALHQKMDEAVLKAYGWEDLELKCGFSLDYFDLEPEDMPPDIQDRIDSNNFYFDTAHEASVFESYVKTDRKSLPWRYRWNQELHDEILGRLLILNTQRHEQEVIMGKSSKTTKASSKTTKRTQRRFVHEGQGELF